MQRFELTLYNKDGSVFKLKGAGKPIEVENWDNVKLHNLGNFDPILEAQETNVLKVAPIKEKVPSKPVKEEPKSEIKEEPKPKEEPKVEQEDDFLKKNKKEMYCCTVEETAQEDFYGDITRRIIFGDKFRFESIIVDQQDLTIHFWTRNVTLTLNSVICLIGRGESRENRWWKITNIQNKSGGFLVEAIPSAYSPDFT